jgi:hypothetical protein
VSRRRVTRGFAIPAACAIALAFGAGCISVTGHPLRASLRALQPVPEAARPSISFRATWLDNGEPKVVHTRRLQAWTRTVLARSGLFAPGPSAAGSIELDLLMALEGNAPLILTALAISALTVGIIPTYIQERATLTVSVSRGGQPVRHYRYAARMDSWIQLLLVFGMPVANPNKRWRELTQDLLTQLMLQLQRDNLLDGRSSAKLAP